MEYKYEHPFDQSRYLAGYAYDDDLEPIPEFGKALEKYQGSVEVVLVYKPNKIPDNIEVIAYWDCPIEDVNSAYSTLMLKVMKKDKQPLKYYVAIFYMDELRGKSYLNANYAMAFASAMSPAMWFRFVHTDALDFP